MIRLLHQVCAILKGPHASIPQQRNHSMPNFEIVDYTAVGNEEAVRSLCLHEELQQGYQV